MNNPHIKGYLFGFLFLILFSCRMDNCLADSVALRSVIPTAWSGPENLFVFRDSG